MKKIILAVVLAIAGALAVLPSGSVMADSSQLDVIQEDELGTCKGSTFLFMEPWYAALDCNGDDILQEQFTSKNMPDTVKKIVRVILTDILRIVGVVAAGFLIYGGYQYVYSGGDSGKATRGRKTITAAIIGMVISLVGQIAVKTFEVIVLSGSNKVTGIGAVAASLDIFSVDSEGIIGGVVNFVLAIATLVAVGFIIYSGVTMMTAYGNADKTAKGRKGIIYSVAGLAVCLLAFAIVNFVLGGLSMATPNGKDTDVFDLINTIFGWVLGISGFIATVGVIVGGVNYIISSGDAQKTQKSKNTIIYSVVGLIIVLVAGGAISFVINAVFST